MKMTLAEYEARKDMLAYVQSIFPYRFGSDLQAGDYVQYEVVDHHSHRESLSTGRSSLSCLVRALEVPNMTGVTPEIRQAVQELSKVYFSEAVPKLLPAKLMAVYLDNSEVFDGNAGLVKQSKYQIRDFDRANK